MTEVMKCLSTLAQSGAREVVLTGINLGAYGKDLRPPASLAQLLCATVRFSPALRLRLSSLEPAEVTPELVAALRMEHVCRHLHLPLQSGSNAVHAAMGRAYSRQQLQALIETMVPRPISLPWISAALTPSCLASSATLIVPSTRTSRFSTLGGDEGAHVAVYLPAPGVRQAFVGHVLRQGVLEHVVWLR